MEQKTQKNKYDTHEKRVQFLKKKGNIITFKKPFYPRGTANEGRTQIIVEKLKRQPAGAVKIIGSFYDSDWYETENELIEAIDWKWMDEMHSF